MAHVYNFKRIYIYAYICVFKMFLLIGLHDQKRFQMIKAI